MNSSRRLSRLATTAVIGALAAVALAAAPASAFDATAPRTSGAATSGDWGDVIFQPQPLRVATYNLSLNRGAPGSSSPTCRPAETRRRRRSRR